MHERILFTMNAFENILSGKSGNRGKKNKAEEFPVNEKSVEVYISYCRCLFFLPENQAKRGNIII